MANAIYSILSYPALSNFIKQNGLTEANNLIWDKPAKKVYQVYKKTLRNVKA
jgi:glycosyltransferase involved in cell wall biosynthesis